MGECVPYNKTVVLRDILLLKPNGYGHRYFPFGCTDASNDPSDRMWGRNIECLMLDPSLTHILLYTVVCYVVSRVDYGNTPHRLDVVDVIFLTFIMLIFCPRIKKTGLHLLSFREAEMIQVIEIILNSFRPSDAYMRQQSR